MIKTTLDDFDEQDWFGDNLSEIEENPLDIFRIAAGVDHLTVYSGLGEHVGCGDFEGIRENYR